MCRAFAKALEPPSKKIHNNSNDNNNNSKSNNTTITTIMIINIVLIIITIIIISPFHTEEPCLARPAASVLEGGDPGSALGILCA